MATAAYGMLAEVSSGVAQIGDWKPTQAPATYPSVYWYSDKGVPHGHRRFTLAFAIMTSCFGALHAIAWHSRFPTFVEQQLWRYCCLVLAAYPLIHIFAVSCSFLCCCASYFVVITLSPPLFTLAVCCYTAARTILIILPFLQFRTLPEGVHQTIVWAEFLPHI